MFRAPNPLQTVHGAAEPDERASLIARMLAKLKEVGSQLAEALRRINHLEEINAGLRTKLTELQDEIGSLKGLTPRPKFKGGNLVKTTEKRLLEEQAKASSDEPVEAAEPAKRPGSSKRAITRELEIHETRIVPPSQPVPEGSVFKGHRKFVVRDIAISAHNICVKREVWLTPDGKWLVGERPKEYGNSHFGPALRAFIVNQHQQCLVTQPLLHEQLTEFGIIISTGQLDRLLSWGIDAFEAEALAVLVAGLKGTSAVTVDDTYAPHKGAGGFATNISGPLFAWYGSTPCKSRASFIALLHAGDVDYCINEAGLRHMAANGLPPQHIAVLAAMPFACRSVMLLEQYLTVKGINAEEHRRIATEGALWGAVVGKLHADIAIVSDGAGQFVVGENHGMCWVHAERLVCKLTGGNDEQRAAQLSVSDQMWELYAKLSLFKIDPDSRKIAALEAEFDEVFLQETPFQALNAQLARLHAHKSELLLVLRRPDAPLHTNQSETDIRDFVRKRKVSGGTRSDLGQLCRDVFSTLKKTCRKLDRSFWKLLVSRMRADGLVEPLSETLAAALALLPPVTAVY